MKFSVSNHKFYGNKPNKILHDFRIQLIDSIQSDIIINQITRTNHNETFTGIKTSEVKNIVKSILVNIFNTEISEDIKINTTSVYNEKFNNYSIIYQNTPICVKLQTANWAILYKDLFQFNYDEYYSIYEYIFYIVPDLKLSNSFSSGTVNFNNSVKIMDKYSINFKKNITIIGLNIQQ